MVQDPRRAEPPVTDPAFADLVARYVAQCQSSVVRILLRLGNNFATDDFAMVAATGRDLAGSGESFGLPRVSALGRSIVEAALAANGAAVMQRVHELQSYLNTLTPGASSATQHTIGARDHSSSPRSERRE
jgi:hypothetical protein